MPRNKGSISCILSVVVVEWLDFNRKKGRRISLNLSPICAQPGFIHHFYWLDFALPLVLNLIPLVIHASRSNHFIWCCSMFNVIVGGWCDFSTKQILKSKQKSKNNTNLWMLNVQDQLQHRCVLWVCTVTHNVRFNYGPKAIYSGWSQLKTTVA